MIYVWSDIKSFQRHLEAMKAFRQNHGSNDIDRTLIKDMPTSYNIDLNQKDHHIKCFNEIKGKVIFVPIWKITVPQGAQN